MGAFEGRLKNTSEYKSEEAFAGDTVLVVDCSNSDMATPALSPPSSSENRRELSPFVTLLTVCSPLESFGSAMESASQGEGAALPAPTPLDISDAFDSSLRLEQAQMEEGYMEGYRDGLASGKEEGRQVGLKHGFAAGEEIGFYRGCVDIWESAIRADAGVTPFFSERVRKWVQQLGRMVEEYPLMKPQNESLQERVGAMRVRFKMITASLGLKIEYEGYPKAEEQKSIDF